MLVFFYGFGCGVLFVSSLQMLARHWERQAIAAAYEKYVDSKLLECNRPTDSRFSWPGKND